MWKGPAKRAEVLLSRGTTRTSVRLLATMVQGTAAAVPETWQTFRTLGEARIGAREVLHNHRVLRVAVVEDRIPLQFVEWVNR